MKLIYAIVGNDYSEDAVSSLNAAGYGATKLSSTGGFLKKGNTTLMVGTEDEKVEDVIGIVEKVCGERKSIEINMPYIASASPCASPLYYGCVPRRVEVGGAVIFVVNVGRYEKI